MIGGIWQYLAKPLKNSPTRRQDYDDSYYFVNGAIYIADVNFFLKHKKFIVFDTDFYIMDKKHGVDIDEYDDLKTAESYLLRMGKKINGL